jgi:P2-related tail formation protein
VVRTVSQLRAVVEWARANPHVERYTYRVTYELVGERIEQCPAGHSLLTVKEHQPYRRELKMQQRKCRACPEHWATTCPQCGILVIDPPLLEGCGPA